MQLEIIGDYMAFSHEVYTHKGVVARTRPSLLSSIISLVVREGYSRIFIYQSNLFMEYLRLQSWSLLPLFVLFAFINCNLYDPHLFPETGPFVEGWYTRLIDNSSAHSFGLLFAILEEFFQKAPRKMKLQIQSIRR